MQLKWTTRLAIVGAVLSTAVVIVSSCRARRQAGSSATTDASDAASPNDASASNTREK